MKYHYQVINVVNSHHAGPDTKEETELLNGWAQEGWEVTFVNKGIVSGCHVSEYYLRMELSQWMDMEKKRIESEKKK